MRQYKDSGIEWIGKIPENWDICYLKCKALIERGGSPRPIEDYISDNGYNWIKIGDTIKGNKYITSVRQKIRKEGLNKTRLVHSGDLILTNSMSFGEPYILQVDGCIHDGWVAISNLNKIDKVFLYYLLLSPFCQYQFKLQVAGGVVQNLNVDKIAVTYILCPPLLEQQCIANYLDEKCGETDSLIALQEQMIEKLKAYKQSIITEAITKGLNPNAKLVPSGIDWIGNIPEGWEINKLFNLCTIKGRVGWKGLRSDEFKENSYAYLVTGQDFVSSDINWNNCYQIDKDRYEEDPYIQLSNGDILVTKDGTIGKIAKVSGMDKPACLNSGIFVLKQRKETFFQNYLYWYLSSPLLLRYNTFINTGGTTIIHLYQNVFERFSMIVPPMEEQKAIAAYLDEKCADIDRLVDLKQQKIEKLKDYKKSVIYEAVTGKTIIKS